MAPYYHPSAPNDHLLGPYYLPLAPYYPALARLSGLGRVGLGRGGPCSSWTRPGRRPGQGG